MDIAQFEDEPPNLGSQVIITVFSVEPTKGQPYRYLLTTQFLALTQIGFFKWEYVHKNDGKLTLVDRLDEMKIERN